jgi:UDP-N-acetylmuramoyl-tripeptide--D-alanyl-D-alanine ligase
MAPVTLTVADVVQATGGTLESPDASGPMTGISIDSRRIVRGDWFIAIRGERFDGHAFVAQAVHAGAAGVIVDRDVAGAAAGAAVIRVPDTTKGLQDLARHVRRRAGTKVVAITGSAGKTTTKEICADFLSARYRVFRNKGNLNNHIGLPLSLLELRTAPEIAVVELGMNHAGEIRTLVGIAEPEVRVWTNVGDAHLGFFPSPEAIADAKAEILEHASVDHLMVANADDPRVMARAERFVGGVVRFGTHERSEVRATDVELRGLDGVRAAVHTPAGRFQLATPLLGLGNLMNVLAATAVATSLGVPVAAIEERAPALRAAKHRGELVRLAAGLTVLDDSYNSSPSALKRSLEVLAAAAGGVRKVAVLGEMRELGDHAGRLHRECGRAAQRAGVDLLFAVGGEPAQELAAAALGAGMSAGSVVVSPDRDAAMPEVLQRVRPGDLVLVKGSRTIGLDAVVDRLKAEYA